MTPKEKAEDLVTKMFFSGSSIESASIAVDEIMNAIPFDYEFTEKFIQYWDEVKQEIENV
jgi:hypothetical protein